ncbi:MAG: hypothetical protein JWM18_848, partial [Chloroflexi bacterium]|nr:hypothetical protein [Chloroflexota bacterium]
GGVTGTGRSRRLARVKAGDLLGAEP